ncbi:MAG: ATP-dependent zinc metalloprotease FtsH [Clostridia bacterium]|nr:ATP-dependent zinc metalloprotease FtsH [Clostridia bacterium]
MKSKFKVILFYALLIGAVLLAVSGIFRDAEGEIKVLEDYSEVVLAFKGEQVKEFTVSEDLELTMIMADDTKAVYQLSSLNLFYNDLGETINAQLEAGKLLRYEYEPATVYPWWVSLLPYAIIIIVFIVLWIFIMNSAVGGKGGAGKMGGFGRARVKMGSSEKKKVLFSDVAGADEEKEELQEVVEFLKNPKHYSKLGARIPHGILLVGPPGTGKTLLAKAVAGEADVPFFSISGSDFVEMYVGVGASRVRDLFDTAKKAPASIIFIDEIDAVGRHRGAGLGGGHDEREQTLNQLLVEMDGFGSNEGIIVIAATNRPDILDPALLRPGRFDRQVTVNYPDIKGREEILKVHAKNKPLEATVDFKRIAQSTVGFTGADLANLLNEAALLAARRGKDLIGMDEIEDAYMKSLMGPQKKNKQRREKDNKLCAYHEAGHAVAAYFCPTSDPVKHITIIPAGSAGGVTVRVPEEDRMVQTRGEMIDNIIVALGGRIAEELILDDISTGASSDISQATKIARAMVERYGMSRLGTVLYGNEHSSGEVFLGRDFSSGKNYSEKTAAQIDDEVRAIIDEAYAKCKSYLQEHIDKLHFVAEFLYKHESMDRDQFEAAMQEGATEEDIVKIAEDKKRESEKENRDQAEKNAQKEAEEKEKAPEADSDNPVDPNNPFGF